MQRIWSWMVLWRPRRPSRNRQVCPWSTKWSRAKTKRECTGHRQYPLPTTQEMLHIDNVDDATHGKWPDGQYHNQIDYILCSWRWKSFIQSAKTRPGVDWGSDHEPLIAKFRLKLKKVGKTTRPFRYDLNQIPYDYTVEVTNGFKRLSLIDRVPEELWNELVHYIGGSDQNHPKEKEIQKGKMVVWGGLTNRWEKRSKTQRRKGKL